MLLIYQGQSVDYSRLLSKLKIKSFGAPASHIRLLAEWNLSVAYSVTDMAGLISLLQQGVPVIVFVQTGELPYWTYTTDHAVVVVGFDDAQLYVNDPAFDDAPIGVPRGDFELAWLERDYYYATISS
jgi:uncharacterized protein YvpB